MAISNYTELQSAVDAWLGHTLFTTHVPEFIAMAEAAFNRRLRLRQQETFVSVTATSGEASLPTDYLSIITVVREDEPFIKLEPTTPEWAFATNPNFIAGVAKYYYITDGSIFVFPPEDIGLSLQYYAKIPALASSINGTNFLLNEHPDLYLFGALIEAEAFGVNDQRLPLWKARRDEIYDDLAILSRRSRGAGVVRVMAATP